MSLNKDIAWLKETRKELFTVANRLAGDETGSSAVLLHVAHGLMHSVVEALEQGINPNEKAIPHMKKAVNDITFLESWCR